MTSSDYVKFVCDCLCGKKHALIFKHFHVPSVDRTFLDLCLHRYEKMDHKDSFAFIEERMRALGYSEDNQLMIHVTCIIGHVD